MLIYNQKETGTPNKEDKKMMNNYEEMDPMVAAEVFGASFLEMLAIAGITLEEFYEDSTSEEG